MASEPSEPIRVGPVRSPERSVSRGANVNYASILRVVLPLGAVALVGGLFFGGALRDGGPSIESLPDDAIQEPGSVGLDVRFTGKTPDGYDYVLDAAEMRPDSLDVNRLELRDFIGSVTLEESRDVSVAAPEGVFLLEEETATLDGGVEVKTSDGYVVETESVRADTAARRVQSVGRIVGHGPAGRICAESMLLTDESGGSAFFEGDVVVILTNLPGAEGTDGTAPLVAPPADEEQTTCQRMLWTIDF